MTPGRAVSIRIMVCMVCMLAAGALLPSSPRAAEVSTRPEERPGPRNQRIVDPQESPAERDAGAVPIRPPEVAPLPASGKGRMSIVFSGNRRWCTFQDDRLVTPPLKSMPGAGARGRIYTFGYQFSIAAVKHSDPGATLMLYSSPVVRTASLRQAGKLGRGGRPGQVAPEIGPIGEASGRIRVRETPATLVPYWHRENRCAVLGERFDFNLDEDDYDVYIAFDLLMRSGAWIHRSYGFLTGIRVESGRRTIVDGLLDLRGGGRRQLELRSAMLEPRAAAGAGRR